MTTIFLSGSRQLSRLNADVRERLLNMMEKNFRLVVGDANGADKAMQRFLAEQNYKDVLVYCSGETCRNNIGDWNTHSVDVPKGTKGRAFYTIKDRAMAAVADYGFVVWDGRSQGSITNAADMLGRGKSVVIYLSPEKRFLNLSGAEGLQYLLEHSDPDIRKKLVQRTDGKMPDLTAIDIQGSLGL